MIRIVSAIVLILFLFGCTQEKYGGAIDHKAPIVKVKDIYLNDSLLNSRVNLEGVIVTQCQSSGCWFFLNDGTGQIFINLAPKGFELPPRTGKKAKVTGIIGVYNQGKVIVAEAVEID